MTTSPQVTPLRPAPGGLCKLPRFEAVAALIRQQLDSRLELPTIMRLIVLDPAIVAEVLVAANSPVYGFSSRVYTVQEAVMILGWEQTQRVVRAAIGADLVPDGLAQSMIQSSWAHSLASACIAAELSASFDMQEERAFTVALMHDIGRLGMLSTSPELYMELAAVQCAGPREFMIAETRRLRMDHCKAGLWLARAWGLPAEFCDAAAAHHDHSPDPRHPAVSLAGLACRLARVCGFAVEHCAKPTVSEALSFVEPVFARELTPRWEEIQAKSLARLLQYTQSFCDVDSMRQGHSGNGDRQPLPVGVR